MPPNLDIYVISAARNRETIERFLDTYVNRAASENRGNEELMILPLDATDTPRELAGWEWEPSATLSHIVDRGLDFPRRAFCVYLSARDRSPTGATLGFDASNNVIFGLSLDDEGAKPENEERAKSLLLEMAKMFDASTGFVGVEEPAPIHPGPHVPKFLVCTWVRTQEPQR